MGGIVRGNGHGERDQAAVCKQRSRGRRRLLGRKHAQCTPQICATPRMIAGLGLPVHPPFPRGGGGPGNPGPGSKSWDPQLSGRPRNRKNRDKYEHVEARGLWDCSPRGLGLQNAEARTNGCEQKPAQTGLNKSLPTQSIHDSGSRVPGFPLHPLLEERGGVTRTGICFNSLVFFSTP